MKKYLKSTEKFPISQINAELTEYNRGIQPSRLTHVKTSISTSGFWPDKGKITLNQNNQIVDGQHRYRAALALGMTEIPVAHWQYSDITEEAKHFCELNSFNTMLANIDEWKGRLIAKCPIALMLEKLDKDRNSPLKGLIKTHRNKPNAVFSYTSVLQIINTVMFNLRADHWKHGQKDDIMKRLISELNFTNVCKELHIFFKWFNAFAPVSQEFCYKQQTLSAILLMYQSLKEQHYLPNLSDSITKQMRQYPFDKTFTKLGYTGMLTSMSNHLIAKLKRLAKWNPNPKGGE